MMDGKLNAALRESAGVPTEKKRKTEPVKPLRAGATNAAAASGPMKAAAPPSDLSSLMRQAFGWLR